MKKILSNNLKRLLRQNGKTQTDLANDLNFPETTVSNWMKANTYPRPDKIQMIADYFGVARSDLTEDKATNLVPMPVNIIKIPILGTIACGEPIYAEENFCGYKEELADYVPNGKLYYLEAKGDSMEPTIPNGSYVMIREQPEVETGEIAAVLVNGDTEATLKRIKRQDKLMILMPDNPSHEPYIITENNPARILGKAIRFTREL